MDKGLRGLVSSDILKQKIVQYVSKKEVELHFLDVADVSQRFHLREVGTTFGR
jgi:hypothetical protein